MKYVNALRSYILNIKIGIDPDDSSRETTCSFFPVRGNGKYLGCLVVLSDNDLDEQSAVICESACAIVSMSVSRTNSKKATNDMILRNAVTVALNILSHSELTAMSAILDYLDDNNECSIVVSDISKEIFVARSVISSALKKLQSSGIIAVKSQGTKGTYIKVLNPYLKNALDEYYASKIMSPRFST